MKLCDRCNKEIYLGMVCQEKDCIYVETFCGLSPYTTGDWDPFWQSGSCPRHDELMTKKEAHPVAIAARFAYDSMNTAVINTAKAVYSVTFVIPYILIGGVGGLIRDIYKRKKK
jgi:hypothetical protein